MRAALSVVAGAVLVGVMVAGGIGGRMASGEPGAGSAFGMAAEADEPFGQVGHGRLPGTYATGDQRPSSALIDGWTAASIAVPDDEPIDVAPTADGGAWVVVVPRFPDGTSVTLRRVTADGRLDGGWRVLDTNRVPIQALSVFPATDGGLWLSSDSKLVRLDATLDAVWDAPAGDAHPDFGAAARALALGPAGLLYGVDLANARVVGYAADTGTLRRRWGVAGTGPGSYLAPRDVAVAPDGRIWVADFGNRRLQVLDGMGTPVRQISLAERPRSVTLRPSGGVAALVESDQVVLLDEGGAERGRLGGYGGGVGRLRDAQAVSAGADGRLWVADRGNDRLVVFSPPAEGGGPSGTAPAPSPTATAPPVATVGPVERVAVCAGRPATVTLDAQIPAAPPHADVLLVFDATASMGGALSVARARALDTADLLAGVVPDVAIGVIGVRDHPYGTRGLSTDLPWMLAGSLTGDPDEFAASAARLRANGGADAPEAYGGAIRAALDDPRVGWRDGARPFVVLIGDSVPRDDDLNEGVPNPPVPGIWPDPPERGLDSGPDWAPGSADDVDWQRLLEDLADDGITLLAATTGAAPAELGDSRAALTEYWNAWTGRTGGLAAEIDQLSLLPERIADVVAASGSRIGRLSVVVQPMDRAGWVTVPPAEHDVRVPPEGLDRSLELTIAPPEPATTAPGTYGFQLILRGDGATYGGVDVEVDWSGPCATPTAPVRPSPTRAEATPTSAVSPSPVASPTSSATAAPTDATDAPDRLWLPVALRHHCLPGERRQVDVALVVDTSASMRGAKLAAARDAAVAFIGLLDLPRDRAAIVTFHGRARLAQWLTGDAALLELALLTPRTGTGTRIDRGLDTAVGALVGGGDPPDRARVIVLLTDGRPDGGTATDALRAAARARAVGISTFTIALGPDADADLLEAIAGRPDRAYRAATPDDLAAIYALVAGNLACGLTP